jgi:D-sedoheptulose 7-phosphate isomerase
MADQQALGAIEEAAAVLIASFESGGRVFSCGNGGSMCDAMHFAEELTGRYQLDRPALPALAINDPSHLSCVGNDYGYDQVFSRYLEAHARSGDCLLALTTSGGSKNVLRAAETARSRGVRVIALTGRPDAAVAELSGQVIRPFTDLLLHDLGEGLSDERPVFEADGSEWRTAPLWGIGLVPKVNGHSFLLHDGRARNLAEAILWHGGEAQKSRDLFRHLAKQDRTALITFLQSL